MKDQKPLFIGLQEVTSDLIRELYPFLESMGYTMISQPGCYDHYGVAIAVLTTTQEKEKVTQTQTPLSSSSPSSSQQTGNIQSVQIIKSGFHSFQKSIMDRGLMWVHGRIIINSANNSYYDVLFTTTHLESFVPKNQYSLPDKENHGGAKARENQIQEAVHFCQEYVKTLPLSSTVQATFITGDLNWDDERKRGGQGTDKPLLSIANNDDSQSYHWIDAWRYCHHNQDGYTYDSKLNPMLKGNLRRRFDRCLFSIGSSVQGKESDSKTGNQNEGKQLGIIDAQLIGTEAIQGIQWEKHVQQWKYGKPTGAKKSELRPVCPSDHFGLYIQFGDSSVL